MILIFITLIAMLAMAKKPRRRRRMGRYLRGTVDDQVILTTLAAKTVVATAFGQTVNERTKISSVVARYTMTEFTPGTGDGPIMIGLAHGDYTDAEIEAWIENTGSWNEGDLPAQEIAGRKIRMVGIFDTPDNNADSAVLNDGKAIKTKMNWILNQGVGLRLWGYNLGTSALATTAPIVRAEGHANLWPQ